MQQSASSLFGMVDPSLSMLGSHSLTGRYITYEEGIARLHCLTIKGWASGMRFRRTLLPCGKHWVFVQCLRRPTHRWFARVRAQHSGECIVPLVVPLVVE